jgi:hypothetical protein
VPFKVTSAEYTLYHSGRPREDLEGVIADEVSALHRAAPGSRPGDDRIVWLAYKALALIRRRPDGQVEVIRLDRGGH